MALLYRMMAAFDYRIPEVNSMLVVECAIALGVDQTHEPKRRLVGTETEADLTPTAADLMSVPTEVMVMDPDVLLGMMGVAQVQP